MKIVQRIRAIPNGQKYRYALVVAATALLLAPLALIPGLFDNPDLCGPLCMRRFFLFFPGMEGADLAHQVEVALVGVAALGLILVVTFFFGRMWCAYLCPVGGVPELLSRLTGERWKLEYRWLPQVPIRYGYFAAYLVLLPMLGVSACTLCNFITVPRVFQALSGDWRGFAFLVSTVGLVNLALVLLLGVFANKGRAYCQFLCPIGAIDALVNRLGSHFRFARRIRVERNRCTGCNECARKCMTGAIRMVDRVAVVDQLSCMSCHECADVCDWGAIDWLVAPPEIRHGRRKKGVEYHPVPDWIALHTPRRWHLTGRRLFLGLLFGGLGLFVWAASAQAARLADPDGCLSCHGLQGLEYLDERGLPRNASVDRDHYLGSLHGAVPCSDCHREIRRFPHEEGKGAVDCAAECHLEEPSGGAAYSHKAVVEEARASVHGRGRSDGFTGANRLEESRDDPYPSCRLCHSNTGYISAGQMPRFADLFAHGDQACGACHEDQAWRTRYGGHVLRRLLGGRWTKAEGNRLCTQCHADRGRMAGVERRAGREQPEAVGPRFVLAADSYAASLHGRLIAAGRETGAACLDCHAPAGLRHGIAADEAPASATHPERLTETCAEGGCHGFAGDPLNRGFLRTDPHDLDLAPADGWVRLAALMNGESWWVRALAALGPLCALALTAWLLGSLLGRPGKGAVYAAFGGEAFKRRMLGMSAGAPSRKPRRPSPGGKDASAGDADA